MEKQAMIKEFQGISSDDPRNIAFLAGQALFSCQRLERCIQVLVSFLAKLGVEGIEQSYANDILEGKSPKPLGQLLGILFKMVTINDVGQTWVQKGLTARNNFVHRILWESESEFNSSEGRLAICERIKKLEHQIIEVHDFFLIFMKEIAKIYGIKFNEVEHETRQRLCE